MTGHSITLRLTALFAAISCVVMVTVGVVLAIVVNEHFEERDHEVIQRWADFAVRALAAVRSDSDLDRIPTHIDEVLTGAKRVHMSIYDGDGRLLYAHQPVAVPAALQEYAAQTRATPRGASRVDLRYWEDGERNYAGAATTAPLGIPGAKPALVAIGFDVSWNQRFMTFFLKTMSIALGLGVGCTALLGYFAARRGLVPVRAIALAAEGVSVSRLGERLQLGDAPKEVAVLLDAINHMLSRLHESFQRLSDFSDDLAHELRTPLTNLITQAEVTLRKARSPDEYREVLYSSLEELQRLARMTSDMLFLAKADHGLMLPRREMIDLGAEVDHLIDFYEPLAESHSIRMRRAGTGGIRGDRIMLRRAVSNLLSNAIRHTARGGVITIAIDAMAPEGVRIAVENPGSAIAPDHLARLFDRFYRVDRSRELHRDGAGLGLAIVKSIVEAHGGRIAVSSAGGTTRFELTLLPLAA